MDGDPSCRIDKFRYEESNLHIDRCQYDPFHVGLDRGNLCVLELLIRNEPGEPGGHQKDQGRS